MEGDWETANAFYPGVDSTACLDGSEPIAIQCRVRETQVAWDLVSYHDVLRCDIEYGLHCVNTEVEAIAPELCYQTQTGRTVCCDDFEVRWYCGVDGAPPTAYNSPPPGTPGLGANSYLSRRSRRVG